MRILGIETSCDETAATIYDGDSTSESGRILAERIASQIETHARFGGIVPEIASREHLKLLPPMVDEIMAEAETGWNDLDAIAVTAGPGLMGALLVGVSYARAAGAANHLPVIPVHHMEGHLLAPGLTNNLPAFPFITLLVSGGHTMLVRVDDIGAYTVIGQTLDDAAGECFDKCARLLGLPYPGGPAIARLAEGGDPERFRLPRPMLNKDNLHFSFSGLKTAVMHTANKHSEIHQNMRLASDLAASTEAAIADVLVEKSIRACAQENIGHLVIAGGVAANQRLRNTFTRAAEKYAIYIHQPHPRYCTDNAAMIAYAG
ncbi:MAG: tRNA (adenosine(37)-N6)-threonylcarbamoyltransferase complex transferase subunit TsaD, partial [Mariprofundaceae bacterium]